MRYVIWIILAIVGMAACSRSPRQNQSLSNAESVVYAFLSVVAV